MIYELHIGSVIDVNHTFLKRHQIKTVINVAAECSYDIQSWPDIAFYHVDIVDEFYDISDYFEPISELIERQLKDGDVLIHCGAGVSRSPTFVLAYMIISHKMDLLSAYNILGKNKIMPNPYFMKLLMDLEYDLLGTRSFYDKIDKYTINYIVCACGLDKSSYNAVKDMYLKNIDLNQIIGHFKLEGFPLKHP